MEHTDGKFRENMSSAKCQKLKKSMTSISMEDTTTPSSFAMFCLVLIFENFSVPNSKKLTNKKVKEKRKDSREI